MPEENNQKTEKPVPAAEPKIEAKPQAQAEPAKTAEPVKTVEPKKAEAPKEKPANCASCNKSIKNKRWYYRAGKYYCSKRCWQTASKKEKAPAKEPAPLTTRR